jgi:hypothetical protein
MTALQPTGALLAVYLDVPLARRKPMEDQA